MKRALSLSLLLVFLIASLPLVQVLAGSVFVPHQDPRTARSDYDIALPILLHYSGVLSLLADAKYKDAGELLEELNIDEAVIPEDVKTVMRRYNSLLSQLGDKLDRLDTLLDLARSSMDEHRLDEARAQLNAAKELSVRARSLLEDVDQASQELIRKLGPFGGNVPTETLDEIKDRLRESLQRIKVLEALLAGLLAEMEADIQKPTQVTLNSDWAQRVVGGTLTLSGTLTAGEDESPLADKQVVILRDGENTKTVTTGSDGSYSTTWTVPYMYVPSMDLQSSYTPAGADRDRYDGSTSEAVHLEVQFEATKIISAGVDDSSPWPDDTINVSGKLVRVDNTPLPDKAVRILLDGKPVKTVSTLADGSFSTTLTVPKEYKPSRTIRVEFAPTAGINGPSSADIPISVQFKDTSLTLAVNQTEVWVGDKVTVSGRLLPADVWGRPVQVLLDGTVIATVNTGLDGSFEVADIVMPVGGLGQLQAGYVYAKDEFAPAASPIKQVDVKLYPTELTLEAGQSSLWVGQDLTVSGTLVSTEDGDKLDGALIEIISGDTVLATLVTDADGRYNGQVAVPYTYLDTQTFQARFVPAGTLEGRYESSSAELEVETLFYGTQLDISLPPTGYPGLPIPLQGTITYRGEAPAIARTYLVYLDNQLAGTFTDDGGLDIELDISALSNLGTHMVRVVVEADGVYSDAEAGREVVVTKLPLQIQLKGTYLTSPPRELRVTGTLVSDLPLSRALVEVTFRGETVLALADEEGLFEAVFDLPMDAVPLGSHDVKVRAKPVESWHVTTELSTTVFVVDIVNLALVSLAFVSVGAVIYSRRRNRREAENAGRPGSRDALPSGLPALFEAEAAAGGRGLQVLLTYGRIVRLIEASLGVRMTPETTLREFSKNAVQQRAELAGPLTKLSSLAEQALYSSRPPDDSVTVEAERLAAEIRGILG